MENNQKNIFASDKTYLNVDTTRTFISGVFTWMFLALTVTALTSWIFATNEALLSLMYNYESLTILGYIVLFAPLGFVLLMGMGFQRLSASTIAILFAIYSVLMGMSLSFIFLLYSLGSIAITFAISAGMFGIMAIAGYTTKTDLTKFGTIMFMGLIGIIIASIINFFMKSSQLDYIISFIGVLVFTGLTAWDVQKLKRIGESSIYGQENTRKLMIMGALTLYLDFINLFLFLLRFLGNKK